MKTNNQISSKSKLLLFWQQSKTVLFILLCSIPTIHAQNNDSNQTINVPQYRGDNFSLGGALALFKQAKSVEQFEKMINDQNNSVNNLDLNDDGNTDYISVNDIKENHAHILVLSTYLSKEKSQDIATINIEKSGDNQANVQIIGDPDLYPANSVSEPIDYNGAVATADNNQVDSRTSTNDQYNQNGINVWGWPIVQYMYNPYYSVWNSPYYWDYQPHWYKPWRPITYNTFYIGSHRYSPYCRNSSAVRLNYSKNIYVTRRANGGYKQNFHNQNFNRSINRSQGRAFNRIRSSGGGGRRNHR